MRFGRNGWMAAVVVGLMMTGGCASDGGGGGMSSGGPVLVDSQVLMSAYADALAEAVGGRFQGGEALADDFRTAEFVMEVIEIEQKKFPTVFAVTESQESAYRSGQFDDAANTATLEGSLAGLEQAGAPLGSVLTVLAAQHEAGSLSGAKLALAARLSSAMLEAEVVSEMQESV